MYWLGNGAVPTFKVQKFMAMFGLFPNPWHYISKLYIYVESAT
jgi:hypothetical protein